MKCNSASVMCLTVWAASSVCSAQVFSGSETFISLLNLQSAVASVPPRTTATTIDLTVDESPEGGGVIDVMLTQPGLVISLVLPTGVEVTAANAASLGFGFEAYTIAPEAPSLLIGPLLTPGAHSVFDLPPGQVSGVYHVKADSTGVATETGLIVTYHSSSPVRAALTTNGAVYKSNDTVVLSALVFNGSTPITGAAVTAKVAKPVPLDGQATIGNDVRVSEQDVDANTKRYTYRADLTNSGGAVPAALADVTSLSADVSVKEERLVFADVPAGGTATSLDTFVIEQPASLPFNPALLSWKIEAPGVPVDVTLLDSGQYDYQAGDGIYTGTFAPTGPGEYTALATVTGTSSGSAFSRQALTTFEVTGPTAGFVSFQDEVADDNGNGLADRLLIRANLDVQTAGTYRLDLNLQDSDGNLLQGGASGELAPGSRQLTVEYSAEQVLASLKTDGPWTLTNALLLYQAGGKDTAAAHAQNAATTGSRRLADFDHGPQYFTGTFSASGVDANGISGFELLRVEAGVHNEAGYCRWSATVEDQQRHGIDYVTGFGDLASGDNVLKFDFCGPKIYRSQKDGPYTVRAELECAGDATGDFITGPLQAAQFEGTSADFTLTPAHVTAAAAAGQKVRFTVDVTSIAGFSDRVVLACRTARRSQPHLLLASGVRLRPNLRRGHPRRKHADRSAFAFVDRGGWDHLKVCVAHPARRPRRGDRHRRTAQRRCTTKGRHPRILGDSTRPCREAISRELESPLPETSPTARPICPGLNGMKS